MTEMEQYIRDYAASIGLNPDVVMTTVLNEGGHQSLEPAGYARQALGTESYGQEQSYGPFQMNVHNGLGARAIAAGFDPRKPEDAFKVAKFAMDTMKTEGLGAWHGWKGDQWAARSGNGTGAEVATPGGQMVGPDGPKGSEHYAQPFTPPDGPKGQEAWAPPAGGPANIATIGENVASQSPYSLPPAGKKEGGLAAMGKMAMNSPGKSWQLPQIEATPGAARIDAPTAPVLDPQASAQRQQLMQLMLARLNQGSLV